ncbi:MAG: universal stress protein [Acidobacteriota bacterium]
MAHVSHKLSSSFEGALAGGGDPATSPLYVFGPFLKLIVLAGVAPVTFGAGIWLVVLTVAMVSAMYRFVMTWVTDGSGGSGLSEEEFGGWAVKVNAGITFVEYTLTFLVSMAALVTFIADRYPALNDTLLGLQHRTYLAIILSLATGWVVNRGPKTAARAFGPATLAVLILLWAMIVATVWKLGFRLPSLDFRAFTPEYLHFTFGGYARILALMTGIEIFANLVAAYSGTAAQKSRKAFGSLLIIMGTTSITMLIVGPGILELSNPADTHVSVFTQTMDSLLPKPLPYLGTIVGIIVLGSASAASAQGLQNLALGLRYRHYVPAVMGQRNRFDVADKPVWLEVGLVSVCYLVFGTHEETYLALYAAGVFILLSMTGWAAAKRLIREMRSKVSVGGMAALAGTIVAALLTSVATVIIFVERFFEGAWTYLLFIPLLYAALSYYRSRLGAPTTLEDHLGRFFVGQYLLPYQREARPEDEVLFDKILVPLDGSSFAEQALPMAELLSHSFSSQLTLVSVIGPNQRVVLNSKSESHLPREQRDLATYLEGMVWQLEKKGLKAESDLTSGPVAEKISTLAHDLDSDLIVMCTHGRSGVERWFLGSVASRLVGLANIPILLIRPTDEWKSRGSRFKRFLVSLDGSQESESALRYARALAKRFGSEIVLLSVPENEVEVERLQNYLDNVAAALHERGFKAQAVVTGSGPARTILAVSESDGMDLILMATRGRGGIGRDLSVGSVAARVVQATQCPVFLVPVGERPVPESSLAGQIAAAAVPS